MIVMLIIVNPIAPIISMIPMLKAEILSKKQLVALFITSSELQLLREVFGQTC
jgi:hypothetical protein